MSPDRDEEPALPGGGRGFQAGLKHGPRKYREAAQGQPRPATFGPPDALPPAGGYIRADVDDVGPDPSDDAIQRGYDDVHEWLGSQPARAGVGAALVDLDRTAAQVAALVRVLEQRLGSLLVPPAEPEQVAAKDGEKRASRPPSDLAAELAGRAAALGRTRDQLLRIVSHLDL